MTKDRNAQSETANAYAESLAMSWRLDSGVGFLIRLLDARYHALYQRFNSDGSITPRQFGVLVTLHQKGAMSLTDLASAVQADRSTLGEMITRMAQKRLVTKRNDGADRRSYEVTLAALGRRELLKRIESLQQLQAAILAPLPVDERADFLRCLRLVACATDKDAI